MLSFLSKETPTFPQMDLVFAISANSGDADATLKLMKESIRKIMNDLKFGNGNVQYAVIAYGSTVVQLGEPSFDSIKDLREYIQKLPKQSRDPQIDKTLQGALNIFQGPNARHGARHVLVVLTDKKSNSTDEDIKTGAEQLDEKKIRVIPVAIGNEADPNELMKITPYRDDLIEATKEGEPWRLAREIIIKALTGIEGLFSLVRILIPKNFQNI